MPFKDVDKTTYHVDAIAWLEATEVSAGFEDSAFRLYDAIKCCRYDSIPSTLRCVCRDVRHNSKVLPSVDDQSKTDAFKMRVLRSSIGGPSWPTRKCRK